MIRFYYNKWSVVTHDHEQAAEVNSFYLQIYLVNKNIFSHIAAGSRGISVNKSFLLLMYMKI